MLPTADPDSDAPADRNPDGPDGPAHAASEARTRRRATVQEARALAHPLRIRILRLCLDRPLTNAELAAALGENPATMLHHVRTLVRTGFLVETAWRRGPRGSTEKPYRATGKTWRLQGTLNADDPAILQSVLQAVAAEIVEAGPGAVVEATRVALALSPAQLEGLVGRLQEIVEQLPDPTHHLGDEPPHGDPYAMLLLLHRRRPADALAVSDDAPQESADES